MRIVGIVLTAVLLALGALPEAASPRTVASSPQTVRIKDIDFHPRVTTIRRGGVVRWSFLDAGTPHNVTSRGAQRFRSSPTKTKGTYSVRFTRPGTYRYVCTIHFMKGKVVVR